MEDITFIEQCGVPCFRFDLSTGATVNTKTGGADRGHGDQGPPWVANRLTRIMLPKGRVIRVQITSGSRVGETAVGVVAPDGTIVGQTPFAAMYPIAFAS